MQCKIFFWFISGKSNVSNFPLFFEQLDVQGWEQQAILENEFDCSCIKLDIRHSVRLYMFHSF